MAEHGGNDGRNAGLVATNKLIFAGGIFTYGTGATQDISGLIDAAASTRAIQVNTNGNNIAWATYTQELGNKDIVKLGDGLLTVNTTLGGAFTGAITVSGEVAPRPGLAIAQAANDLLTIQNVEAADAEVTVNMELARSYQKALRNLSEKLCIKNDVTVSTLTRFPDVLATRHADVDEEQLWADVSAVTAQALDNFIAMRAAEGAKMKADVESRLCFLEERVGRVETLSAGRVEAYTSRLYEKLKTILEDRSIDDARVLTEAAIFGDKTAVDEETVRLRSHIAQYRSILELDEPVGRKLDFLTQELNRETNTIGSKCQDLDITRTVVDMKAEIEKIREQIQNLE